MTRAGLLRHALSQALRRVHIGAKKLKIERGDALANRWRGRRGAAPLYSFKRGGRLVLGAKPE